MAEMMGAWTAYTTDVSGDAKNAFDAALKGLVGVKYTPLAFAAQEVNGVRYRFFCNMKGVYPNALNEAAIVEVYKPANGGPHIVSIQKV